MKELMIRNFPNWNKNKKYKIPIDKVEVILIEGNFPIEINVEQIRMVFPNLINRDELEMESNLEDIQVYPWSFAHHLMSMNIIDNDEHSMQLFH